DDYYLADLASCKTTYKVPNPTAGVRFSKAFFAGQGDVLVLYKKNSTDLGSWLADTATGQIIGDLSVPPHEYAFTLSANRNRAAWFADDGKVHVADLESGKQVWELATAHKFNEFSAHPRLALSPDGRYLAVAKSDERRLEVWDLRHRRLCVEVSRGP